VNVKVSQEKLIVTAMKLQSDGTGPGTEIDKYEVPVK